MNVVVEDLDDASRCRSLRYLVGHFHRALQGSQIWGEPAGVPGKCPIGCPSYIKDTGRAMSCNHFREPIRQLKNFPSTQEMHGISGWAVLSKSLVASTERKA